MTDKPLIAIVGLGEVGSAFAAGLLERGILPKIASRPSRRAQESAARLSISLSHDIPATVADAAIVLLTITGDGLYEVVESIATSLEGNAILADMTAAAPSKVVAAADLLGDGASRFVDVAIMGAVSLYGMRTPLLASGAAAPRFAATMTCLGFNVSAREGSAIGDASRLKLLRSIFAKGLDAVVIESMLAAEALGLRDDLVLLLSDFDERPLRDHIDMYLRTHPQHAARRLVEMELSEAQLKDINLPSLTTRAAIERYRRTVHQVCQNRLPPGQLDAGAAIDWLLSAELASKPRAGAQSEK